MPRACASCGASIDDTCGALCASCSLELSRVVGGRYCRSCGEDRADYLLANSVCTRCTMRRSDIRFDGFVKVGPFRGPLRAMILRFKREFYLDRLLGELLGTAIVGQFQPQEIDLWVPVPSHWRRRMARGFQPTALLASQVARTFSGRHAPALIAARYVPELHRGMSMKERRSAVKGAFRVRRGLSFEGRSVCIIDDVTTTGATLAEAKRAMRAAGARRVFAAVVAKAAS